MKFKGFNRRISDAIRSWDAPEGVTRKLLELLVPLVDANPIGLPQDGEGMYYPVDFEYGDIRYYFTLRFHRTDEDFMATDLTGVGYDIAEDRAVWFMPELPPSGPRN